MTDAEKAPESREEGPVTSGSVTPENVSEAPWPRIAGWLAGNTIETPVVDEDGGEIRLSYDDAACSGCGQLITTDPFGEGAPVVLLLGQMKRRYGETYCAPCHGRLDE